jgi:hypothetical protein
MNAATIAASGRESTPMFRIRRIVSDPWSAHRQAHPMSQEVRPRLTCGMDAAIPIKF